MHFLIPVFEDRNGLGERAGRIASKQASKQASKGREGGKAPKDGGGGAMKRILALALDTDGERERGRTKRA